MNIGIPSPQKIATKFSSFLMNCVCKAYEMRHIVESTEVCNHLLLYKIKSINIFCLLWFAIGCILGFPILGVDIDLHDLQVGRGTSLPMITAGVAQCIYQSVSKASPVLLEPFMDLEVSLQDFLIL